MVNLFIHNIYMVILLLRYTIFQKINLYIYTYKTISTSLNTKQHLHIYLLDTTSATKTRELSIYKKLIDRAGLLRLCSGSNSRQRLNIKLNISHRCSGMKCDAVSRLVSVSGCEQKWWLIYLFPRLVKNLQELVRIPGLARSVSQYRSLNSINSKLTHLYVLHVYLLQIYHYIAASTGSSNYSTDHPSIATPRSFPALKIFE